MANPSKAKVIIRPSIIEDLPHLDKIRQAAFEPIFAFFRSTLGEEVYDIAQAHEDRAQGELLTSLLASESKWKVYTAEVDSTIVGFVSIQLDQETKVGEIGLNAVRPDQANKGIGTTLYSFAIDKMKEANMQVATVSAGGDPSYAPARRAYEKAGFTVQIPSVWLCQKL